MSVLGGLIALGVVGLASYGDYQQRKQAREYQQQMQQALNAEQVWLELRERVVLPAIKELLDGGTVYREHVEPYNVASGFGFDCLIPPEKLVREDDVKVFQRKIERKFSNVSGIPYADVRKRHLVQVHGNVVNIMFPS